MLTSIVIFYIFFFFTDTATTEIYTLSLHDALPISILNFLDESPERKTSFIEISRGGKLPYKTGKECRSEERFSRNAETDLVCRLLLEKKKRGRYHRDTPRRGRVVCFGQTLYHSALT